MLLLRDPLGLTEHMLGVPQPLAPLLALCDGTRDLVGIHTALTVRWGMRIKARCWHEVVGMLDEACLLDNDRARARDAGALREYPCAPYRVPSLAGGAYPAEAEALGRLFLRPSRRQVSSDGRGQPGPRTGRGDRQPAHRLRPRRAGVQGGVGRGRGEAAPRRRTWRSSSAPTTAAASARSR